MEIHVKTPQIERIVVKRKIKKHTAYASCNYNQMPTPKNPFFVFKNANGKRYRFYYRKPHRSQQAHGVCCPPEYEDPFIQVDGNLLPRKQLSVTIEEMAHAFFFEKPEWQIRPFAAKLTKLLYKSGWRKAEPKPTRRRKK